MLIHEFNAADIRSENVRKLYMGLRYRAKGFALSRSCGQGLFQFMNDVDAGLSAPDGFLRGPFRGRAALMHLIEQAPYPFPVVAVQFIAIGGRSGDLEHRLLSYLTDGEHEFYQARSAYEDTRYAFAYRHGSRIFLDTGHPTPFPGEGDRFFDAVKTVSGVLFYLLAHAPERLAMDYHEPRRGVLHGRTVRYGAHHTVDLLLPAEPLRMPTEEPLHGRESPRRHNVRRHYRHYHLGPSCGCRNDPEAWEMVETSPDGEWMHKGRCKRCGGIKTCVGPFDRGDAGKGYVTKTYNVEART